MQYILHAEFLLLFFSSRKTTDHHLDDVTGSHFPFKWSSLVFPLSACKLSMRSVIVKTITMQTVGCLSSSPRMEARAEPPMSRKKLRDVIVYFTVSFVHSFRCFFFHQMSRQFFSGFFSSSFLPLALGSLVLFFRRFYLAHFLWALVYAFPLLCKKIDRYFAHNERHCWFRDSAIRTSTRSAPRRCTESICLLYSESAPIRRRSLGRNPSTL